MKRILALVFMCGAGSCIAIDAAPTKKIAPPTAAQQAAAARAAAAEFAKMAPADEYFGPLKESIIGISNTIRDIGLRYDRNHDIPDQSYDSALLTESAVLDWAKRYPQDPQLPRNIYFLQRLYTKILTPKSRNHAAVIATLLYTKFGNTSQARQLKKIIATQHLAPYSTPIPTAPPTEAPESSAPPSAAPTPSFDATVAPRTETQSEGRNPVAPQPSPDAAPSVASPTPSASNTPRASAPASASPAPQAGSSPAPAPVASASPSPMSPAVSATSVPSAAPSDTSSPGRPGPPIR